MNGANPFPSLGWRSVLALVAVVVLLAASAERLSLFSAFRSGPAHAPAAEPGAAGARHGWLGQFWPLELSSRVEVAPGDPALQGQALPLFSSLQTATVIERKVDPETLSIIEVPTRRLWIEHRFGYLAFVGRKILETIEIAAWGTLLAIGLALPLSVAAAGPMLAPAPVRAAARAGCAALRAIPELISALFLVSALGFGPLPGILALGAHAAGFLGRFYADAIEDADQRPVEALRASGAGWLATLRFALLPQVRGPAVSATLYVFDRNVRMATVIGVVGAGGIGQELRGRMDTFEYHHVATILAAILIVVLLVDYLATRMRRRMPRQASPSRFRTA